MISNLLHLPPLGYSDHEVLIWSYICYSDPPVMSQDHLVFKFSKGDYVAFNEYLNSIDWISLFNGNDLSTNWHIFEEKMLSGCKKFIPTFFPKDKRLTPLGGPNHCPKLFIQKEFFII